MKASYGRGAAAIGAAKDHVRYMVHRPDSWGNVQHHELWGNLDVDKQAAYAELDRAAGDVYRLVLSPDPIEQDAGQDLDLRTWADAVMQHVEAEHPGVRWFAVEHQDSEHRHVHAVALLRNRLDVDDLRAMRAAADDNAREQIRERSQVLERDR